MVMLAIAGGFLQSKKGLEAFEMRFLAKRDLG